MLVPAMATAAEQRITSHLPLRVGVGRQGADLVRADGRPIHFTTVLAEAQHPATVDQHAAGRPGRPRVAADDGAARMLLPWAGQGCGAVQPQRVVSRQRAVLYEQVPPIVKATDGGIDERISSYQRRDE